MRFRQHHKECAVRPNPVLHKLGFADSDRVVIIHTDDIGMCQASVAAYSELADFGLISSAATMTPCGWFPALAAHCRDHPQADVGVHLTLNCEWDLYRWAPISTCDPASGLIDGEGYFWRQPEETQARATVGAVAAELEAQVQRAVAAGIDVTHVDTHMGTVAHPRFIASYVQVALKHRLPFMNPRQDEAGYRAMGMAAETAAAAAAMVSVLEAEGLPLLDNFAWLPLDEPADRVDRARRAFDALPAGITHFVIHPAADTPELRAIAPDWRCRVADFEAFRSDELRQHVRASGTQVIGYRPLRDLLRGG